MPLITKRKGPWRQILLGAGISVALMGSAWGDAYLDALMAEAEEGGAQVDNTSVTQVSMEDLTGVLEDKMPATAQMFSKLGPEVQEEILEGYREDLDIYKVSLEVLRQSRNRPR